MRCYGGWEGQTSCLGDIRRLIGVSGTGKKNKLIKRISYLRFVEAAVGYEGWRGSKLLEMASCSGDISRQKSV